MVADEGSLGLVIGGSGNGEQIAANKVPGARAALAWNVDTAKLARQHNNALLAGIGARMHEVDEIERIVEAFLGTEFEGGRHANRVALLTEYERTGEPPALPGPFRRGCRCHRAGWGCRRETVMTSPDEEAERAARQVFDEQESNARATAGAGPRGGRQMSFRSFHRSQIFRHRSWAVFSAASGWVRPPE